MADIFVTLISVNPLQSRLDPVTGIPHKVSEMSGIHANAAVNVSAQSGPVVQGHKLDGNTVALWRFDETVGTANAVDELSLYELGVYPYTGSTPVAGKIHGARASLAGAYPAFMVFERLGDAGLGAVFNGNFTVEQWVWVDSITGTHQLFAYNGPNFTFVAADLPLVDFAIDSTGHVRLKAWQSVGVFSTVTSVGTLSLSTWHHVACTRESTAGNTADWKIYIDGALDGASNLPGLVVPVAGASHFLGVGNYVTVGLQIPADVLNGRLDDTRVSNVARSPAEILESYQRGQGLLP